MDLGDDQAVGVREELLVDKGRTGNEVLAGIPTVRRSRYDGRELEERYVLACETDLDLQDGTSDHIHIPHLLAELGV